MSTRTAGRRIALATLVAGPLDLTAASLLTLSFGHPVTTMLRRVASGPFPDAPAWGSGGAFLGVAVHFALMAIMVAIFVFAADRVAWLKRQPIAAGVAYGLITYAAMNLVILPLRWPDLYPSHNMLNITTQLLCHVFLVGIPVALIARR